MTTNLKPNHSGAASQDSVTSFRRGSARQSGDIRAIATTEGSVVNAGHIFPAASAVRESIEETFGKFSLEARLRADKKIYQLTDRMPNAFGKMKKSGQ